MTDVFRGKIKKVNAYDEWSNLRTQLISCLSSPNGQSKTKEFIRLLHEEQRKERSKLEETILRQHGTKILSYFAESKEIIPVKIKPQLVLIEKSDCIESHIFRAATLLWSVPVSKGYGRRMRYLVIDRNNSKLIGIFALGDPVFNLKCRDEWIGWNVNQRSERLAFMLDAYVLGAVPPYSSILGGKLIGALLASREIRTEFRKRYAKNTGVISNSKKDPYLTLLTTTSALGRSSIYNRLKLPGIIDFKNIGSTDGWGHFLITNDLFGQIRLVLRAYGDPYYNNYKFGQGPSWKLRALRKACNLLNIDENLLHHGIQREVYTIPLVSNFREILLGQEDKPRSNDNLYRVSDVATVALKRWVIPRSERNSDWSKWTRQDTWKIMTSHIYKLDE
jgi:hypothetical protein